MTIHEALQELQRFQDQYHGVSAVMDKLTELGDLDAEEQRLHASIAQAEVDRVSLTQGIELAQAEMAQAKVELRTMREKTIQKAQHDADAIVAAAKASTESAEAKSKEYLETTKAQAQHDATMMIEKAKQEAARLKKTIAGLEKDLVKVTAEYDRVSALKAQADAVFAKLQALGTGEGEG